MTGSQALTLYSLRRQYWRAGWKRNRDLWSRDLIVFFYTIIALTNVIHLLDCICNRAPRIESGKITYNTIQKGSCRVNIRLTDFWCSRKEAHRSTVPHYTVTRSCAHCCFGAKPIWRRKIRCMKRYPGWVLGICIGRYSSHAFHHHCEVKSSVLLKVKANINSVDSAAHLDWGV